MLFLIRESTKLSHNNLFEFHEMNPYNPDEGLPIHWDTSRTSSEEDPLLSSALLPPHHPPLLSVSLSLSLSLLPFLLSLSSPIRDTRRTPNANMYKHDIPSNNHQWHMPVCPIPFTRTPTISLCATKWPHQYLFNDAISPLIFPTGCTVCISRWIVYWR